VPVSPSLYGLQESLALEVARKEDMDAQKRSKSLLVTGLERVFDRFDRRFAASR
jgi:hypothetical protein